MALRQDEEASFSPAPQSVEDAMPENGDDSNFDFEPSLKMAIKVAKPGVRWLWDWYKGYKVVLLGPPLAGKTRFHRYLYTLELSDDELTELARAKNRTLVVDNSHGLRVLRVGKPPGVLLRIRAVVDSPGVNQGTGHAEKLTDKKEPTSGGHVVILVLDGGKRDEAVQWIHEFASRLAEILSQANKLCELFVLLNKYDQAKPYYAELETAVNEKLSASLKLAIGERANRIKLFPTILIRHKDAERLLDRVIEEMAFTLNGRTKTLKESINKGTTAKGDA